MGSKVHVWSICVLEIDKADTRILFTAVSLKGLKATTQKSEELVRWTRKYMSGLFLCWELKRRTSRTMFTTISLRRWNLQPSNRNDRIDSKVQIRSKYLLGIDKANIRILFSRTLFTTVSLEVLKATARKSEESDGRESTCLIYLRLDIRTIDH